METENLIPLIVLTLLLSALFSGVEIAFLSINKLKVEISKNQGSLSGNILSNFNQNPSRFIATMLVGNNIALVALGSLMAQILTFDADIAPGLVLLIQTLITTIVVLIFGEFFPKILFRINSFGIMRALAIPLKYLVYLPLYPLTTAVVQLSKFIIRVGQGKNYEENSQDFSIVDLEHFVKDLTVNNRNEGEEEVDDINSEILEKAIYLRDVKIRECMIPRMEVEAIEVSSTIDELKERFLETKLSKLVVYEGSLDNVVGYTHHFELLKNPKSIRDIMFEITAVPESMKARDLLPILSTKRRSMAWVVDEYGGTSGIVTLEDIIEEIFGEIQDEHDEEDFVEKRLGENEYVFSGRLEVDYLNEKYDLGIPDGDYETLSGYILAHNEDIPERGDELEIDQFSIRILSGSDNRIETIRIKKLSLD
jgi:CBS domain containing-hemolysin-like protein